MERARDDGESDSFEKTFARGAIFTHLVNERRRRSVVFDFADSEAAYKEKGALGAGVDRESEAAELELGDNGRESASESTTNGSSISRGSPALSSPALMSCSWHVSRIGNGTLSENGERGAHAEPRQSWRLVGRARD